jgi:hypothetical protein
VGIVLFEFGDLVGHPAPVVTDGVLEVSDPV